MKRKITSTGPSKNFLSQIETPYVSSYMAYAMKELVPTWLRVPIWSGTKFDLVCVAGQEKLRLEACMGTR